MLILRMFGSSDFLKKTKSHVLHMKDVQCCVPPQSVHDNFDPSILGMRNHNPKVKTNVLTLNKSTQAMELFPLQLVNLESSCALKSDSPNECNAL